MRILNYLTTVGTVGIFGLSLFDAWKATNRLSTSALIALSPTLIVAGSYLIAAYFGRKTSRQLLLESAASLVCFVGLVAYTGYALAGQGNPDTASQLHVLFFPALLGLFALAVMGVCLVVAHVQQTETKAGGTH